MLDRQLAEEAIIKDYPNAIVRVGIEYKNKWFFVVYRDDTEESFFDPFYSVDKVTGEVRDFSIIDDQDSNTIFNLLQTAISKEEE